jgi:hypothetical protein
MITESEQAEGKIIGPGKKKNGAVKKSNAKLMQIAAVKLS